MNPVESSVNLFRNGFVCSQAVLASYAEDLGLNQELALKLAAPFGGGIARQGEICGAVNGAIMALGLKYGLSQADDRDGRDNCYRVIRAFIKNFEARHGSILCRKLLGLDIGNPEEYALIREKNLFATLCPEFVKSASGILGELLK